MKPLAIFAAVASCFLGCSVLRGQPPGNLTFCRAVTNTTLITTEYPAKKFKDIFGSGAKDPQVALEASGMTFPPGSFARWESGPERLVVRNTQLNLDLLEALQPPLSEDFDPTYWSDPDHVRSQAELVGTFADRGGYLSEQLDLAADGGFRLHHQGHMEPEPRVYQGTWRLHNGWVVLEYDKTNTEQGNPSRYYYAKPDKSGYVLSPFLGLKPDRKTPSLIVHLRSVATDASRHVP